MTEGIYDITTRLPKQELTNEQYQAISDAILSAITEEN